MRWPPPKQKRPGGHRGVEFLGKQQQSTPPANNSTPSGQALDLKRFMKLPLPAFYGRDAQPHLGDGPVLRATAQTGRPDRRHHRRRKATLA